MKQIKIAANSASVEHKQLRRKPQDKKLQREVENEESKSDQTAKKKDKEEFDGEFILF